MSKPFFALLRNELIKAAHRRVPYFGVFAVGLLCLVIYFVAGRLSSAATTNAWGYLAFSMQLVFTDIGPIFIVVFSALLLSEETGNGTIRAALAAPVLRWELYAAKAAMGLIYMLVLSLAAVLFSTAFAGIHYHFGTVSDSFGVIYDLGTTLRAFLLGYVLSWVPLVALVMFGLFVSVIIRSPGTAVAVGSSSLFIIDFTKHIVGLDAYVFTKDFGYSWVMLQQMAQGMDYQWTPDVWRMITLSSISAIICFLAGLFIFVREDLNH